MQTVGEYAEQASRQLNDQALGNTFLRWTLAMWVSYLNLALGKLVADRPDAFTSRQTLTLVSGAVQTLPGTMLILRTLYHNVSSGHPIREMDWEMSRSYGKPCMQPYELDCQGAMLYDVEAYAYNPNEHATFVVSPPVPAGLMPQVSAMVVVSPVKYTTADVNVTVPVDARFSNMIYAWMLARAWEVDTESSVSAELVKQNEARYNGLINGSLKYEGAAYAGATLGQEPLSRSGG